MQKFHASSTEDVPTFTTQAGKLQRIIVMPLPIHPSIIRHSVNSNYLPISPVPFLSFSCMFFDCLLRLPIFSDENTKTFVIAPSHLHPDHVYFCLSATLFISLCSTLNYPPLYSHHLWECKLRT